MTEELDAAKQWEEEGGIKVRLECGETLNGIEKSLIVLSFSDTPAGREMSHIWDMMPYEDKKVTGLLDIRLGKPQVVFLGPGMSLGIVLPDGTVKNVVDSDIGRYIREAIRPIKKGPNENHC